jgi:hypothetical protein
MKTRAAVLALSALLASPGSSGAQLSAQVHLATGFVPDPAILEGRAGGSRPATELSPQCPGFVGARPNHVLALDTRFGFLRIFATGPGDLVLAVRTSDERWLCSDDRFGPHPSVEGLFPAGVTEIWVGVAETGAQSSYAVRITETRSIRPGVGVDVSAEEGIALARDVGLDVEAIEGLYQGIRLRRGFLPDPRWLEGTAGGPIDAGGLGGTCRGRITSRPTHVVELHTELDFMQLYAEVQQAGEELSIIVLTPEGRFLCDGATRDVPAVSADAWGTGLYRVWIGAHAEDTSVRYRLGLTEIRRVR